MFLTWRSLFLGRRTHVDPTVAAVVADASQRRVVNHGGIVDVVNLSDVHVVHRTVVIKTSVVPTPTFITAAEITVAIVDSAIETYNRTPIAFVKDETATAPGPIAGGPEETNFRS